MFSILSLKLKVPVTQQNLSFDSRKLSLILIYTFGIYGWGTTKNIGALYSLYSLMALVILVGAIFAFYLAEKVTAWVWNLKIRITFGDLCVCVAFFVFLFALHINSINDPLTVDELAYAKMANIHGYAIAMKILPIIGTLSDNLPLSVIIQLFSLCMLLMFAFICFHLLRIRSAKIFYLLVGITLIVFRVIVNLIEANSSPHPPLAFLPYSLFSSILGVYSSSYRLCSLALASVFLTMFHREALKLTKNNFYALLFIGCIVSIPLIRDSFIAVEVAVWTFWVVTLLIMKTMNMMNQSHQSIIVGISIFSYFRITILFVALIILTLTYSDFIDKLKKRDPFSVIIVAFVIPNVVVTVFTRFRQQNLMDESALNLQTNQRLALVVDVAKSALIVPSVCLVSFALFCVFVRKFHRCIFTVSVLALASFFVFVIPSELMNNAKYFLEYLLPLVSLSLLALKSGEPSRWIRFAMLWSTSAVLIFGFMNHSEIQKRVYAVQDGNPSRFDATYRFLVRIPFEYDEAFKYIRKKGLGCLNAGVVYGQFSEVLAQLSPSQVDAARAYAENYDSWKSRNGESWRTISKESLDASSANCVLIGAIDNKNTFISGLRNTNWRISRIFKDESSGTSLIILEKRD